MFVAATTVPVLVRANFDNARIWGIEHSAEARVANTVTAARRPSRTCARRTRRPGCPPNIEGGTPAPDAWFAVALDAAGRARGGSSPTLHVGWEQTHLSSLDLGDRRTGAGRTRASIRAFFLNGARARGWISAGADNVFGTADDLLTVTGETLAQIQDRVLGVGVNSSSLFPTIPGYATFGVRASFRAGRHQVTIDAENLSDKNYRGISWGMDAPGPRGLGEVFHEVLGASLFVLGSSFSVAFVVSTNRERRELNNERTERRTDEPRTMSQRRLLPFTPLQFLSQHIEIRPRRRAYETQRLVRAPDADHVVGLQRVARLAVERDEDLVVGPVQCRPHADFR